MWKLQVMLKRTIPEIEIEYTWSRPVESIVVDLGPRIPREIIPDMIHNIYRFFNLSKNANLSSNI